MRLTKTLLAAAVATTVAGSALAGGFSDEIVEAPVVVVEPVATAAFSLPAWVIPAAVLGTLVAVAAADDS